jgi:hypothetical protein
VQITPHDSVLAHITNADMQPDSRPTKLQGKYNITAADNELTSDGSIWQKLYRICTASDAGSDAGDKKPIPKFSM